MDYDLILVLGLLVAIMSTPSLVGAVSDGRTTPMLLGAVTISLGLMIFALWLKPGGYSIAEIPDAVLRVAARFLN